MRPDTDQPDAAMKRALYILGLLHDTDIDWLVNAGAAKTFGTHEPLIEQGIPNQTLYILLDGSVAVSTAGKQVAVLGVGEVLGEISLLDSRPPNATVQPLRTTCALAVPFWKLQAKLKSDPAFAGRFYRALAVFLAQRMRATMLSMSKPQGQDLDEDVELADEIDPEVLERITLAEARFRHLMERLNVT